MDSHHIQLPLSRELFTDGLGLLGVHDRRENTRVGV